MVTGMRSDLWDHHTLVYLYFLLVISFTSSGVHNAKAEECTTPRIGSNKNWWGQVA